MILTHMNGRFELHEMEDTSVLRSLSAWTTSDPQDITELIRILNRAQTLMRADHELEPCPACGTRGDLRYKRDEVGRYYVECPCGMGSVLREMTISRMVTAWNNQAREIIRKREGAE